MSESRPRFPVRRFDVFADYHYVTNLRHGMADDVAKGRAVWAAKVVAGRRYGAAPSAPARDGGDRKDHPRAEEEDDGFRSVGGELQTDSTFEREIVDRMGREFYDRVFHPAIEEAVRAGKRYEEIRDAIRQGWK